MSTIKNKENGSIGIYRERSLHLALKNYFCPDEGGHEYPVGKHIADAFDGKTIYEIQTGSLYPLRSKIKYYAENTEYDVLVIHPLGAVRKVMWIDEKSGEISGKPRTSGKHEGVFDALAELFHMQEHIDNEKIKFCFPLMEITEKRVLNGWSKDKKKGSDSLDKIGGEIFEVKIYENKNDIIEDVRDLLPNTFSRAELAKITKRQGRKLWAIQKMILELGIAENVSLDARKVMFEKKK